MLPFPQGPVTPHGAASTGFAGPKAAECGVWQNLDPILLYFCISEYFFTQLFVDYNNLPNGFYYLTDKESTTALCSAALLLWRTFSFTLPLLISAIVTAFYHATPSNIEKEEDMPSRKTYVAMQSETLVSRQNDLDMTIGAGKNILSKEAILNKLKLSKKTKKSKKKENNRSDFDAVDINVEDEE